MNRSLQKKTKETHNYFRYKERSEPLSNEDQQREEEWDRRCDALTRIDMRQFFRAGFQQVKETVQTKSTYKYVFAVPSFLEGPLLSDKESESLKVLEDVPAAKPPTGADADFLAFMEKSCAKKRSILDTIDSQTGPAFENTVQRVIENQVDEAARPSRELVTQKFDDLREQERILEEGLGVYQQAEELAGTLNESSDRADLQQHLDQCSIPKHEMEQRLASVRELLSEEESIRQEVERIVEVTRTRLEEGIRPHFLESSARVVATTEAEITSLNSRVRDETTRFLYKADATVQGSHVIHACAANHVPEFIDILIEFVPASERSDVLNGFADNGMTPLMRAAISSLSQAKRRFHTVERLIYHGADKDIVDAAGESCFRQASSTKEVSQ